MFVRLKKLNARGNQTGHLSSVKVHPNGHIRPAIPGHSKVRKVWG